MRRALEYDLISLLKSLGAEEVSEPHEGALLVRVNWRRLPGLIQGLLREVGPEGVRHSTCVGIDARPLNSSFKVLHILALDKVRKYLIVEVGVREDRVSVPSITPLMPAANWAEREAMDLLGIRFEGHPEPYRLILPDDWPEGVYPLRKDFPYNRKLSQLLKGSGRLSNEPRSFSANYLVRQEEGWVRYAAVPFGPYHPALHEPEYFEVLVEGERVIDARYRGFFVHRGMEKLAESRMTVNQIPFLAERICGICGYTHACAYCQAVEAAAGIDVPERALYIRSILLEIERLHSHLLWLGIACHLLGFDTGFMHSWRIREKLMWLAERLTGNRKTYGMNLVGGVRRDILEYRKNLILRTLKELRREFREFVDSLTSNKAFLRRCEGVGVLPYDRAVAYSTVGPTARGSGRNIDVRRDHPYAAYKDLDFRVPVHKGGDVLSRALVRIEEIFESVWIIEQALDKLPGGPLREENIRVEPGAEGLGYTEAPRGENVHYVMLGRRNSVYRWRPRASTYNNLPAVPEMLKGYTVADAPLIVASIDPCFSCTERVVIIDVESGKKKVLSEEEFNALSVKASRRCLRE